MSEIASTLLHGFDTAVLTHENNVEAMPVKVSPFSEMVNKHGLFLVSKDPSVKPKLNNKIKKGAGPKKTRNRKRVIYCDEISHRGKKYRVNSAKSGLYVEIIRAIINQFEIAIQKWKRVLVLRFDLHQPSFTADNKHLTKFRKRLFQKLKREYGFSEIGFCWVREQERAKAQHYHWVLFLDGRLIRHSKRINEMIKQAWERPTGGYHVPIIKHPFYFADSNEIVRDAIYRVSYLAKTRGKGYRDNQTKDYQCSRMKKL